MDRNLLSLLIVTAIFYAGWSYQSICQKKEERFDILWIAVVSAIGITMLSLSLLILLRYPGSLIGNLSWAFANVIVSWGFFIVGWLPWLFLRGKKIQNKKGRYFLGLCGIGCLLIVFWFFEGLATPLSAILKHIILGWSGPLAIWGLVLAVILAYISSGWLMLGCFTVYKSRVEH